MSVKHTPAPTPCAPAVHVAALSVALAQDTLPAGASYAPPTTFRLLPLGRFRAADGSGRPLGIAAGWLLTLDGAQRLVAAQAARGTALVIDYEHQTLTTAENGQPAPAAGWCEHLEVRADGLYAVDVQWTPRAAAML